MKTRPSNVVWRAGRTTPADPPQDEELIAKMRQNPGTPNMEAKDS